MMIYLMLLWYWLHRLRLKPLAVVESVLTAGLQWTGSTVGTDFAAEHLYTCKLGFIATPSQIVWFKVDKIRSNHVWKKLASNASPGRVCEAVFKKQHWLEENGQKQA